MTSNLSHQTFPIDLPVPKDDGACDHFKPGFKIPPISLPIARNPSQTVDLSKQEGLTVVFCYPRTGTFPLLAFLLANSTLSGALNEKIPPSWNAIPGARGCTPQACSFRDAFDFLTSLGVKQVFGVSTQSPDYQAEVHKRLGLPYDLLSDQKLRFVQAMNLPTFEWEGNKVIRRLTIAIKDGKVVKVWYPVFPPDGSARQVVDWLEKPENAGVGE